ncbi:MAG: glycine--tRNA ligase [Patescibacteria group bacterium]|nr:glycine--tRNA ligase [Patescibacteria group bacterium]
MNDLMDKIVSLCKRRGFVYPGSEIYGGLANTYDYGPVGVELLRNIKNLWWQYFVLRREDIFGLDTNVLMNAKVWEASGHTANFADTMVDCKNCKLRKRADHLIEEYYEKNNQEIKVEGLSEKEQDKIILEQKIPCPNCGKHNWTNVRKFNTLFETHLGIVSGDKSLAYLRGEIAQGMFVNFKNVLDSLSPRLPFGLAQTGLAFRNEITPGKFIHRTLSFNLSEFEYFFDPDQNDWQEMFDYWVGEMENWTFNILGIKKENIRWREHTDEERSHYSKKTSDIEYKFPWGFKELYGLAYRTDFDLRNHTEKSGVDLRYTDPKTGRKFIPHVVEPTFGMDRTFLAVILDSYAEEEINGKKRVLLKLKPSLAPYKAAVFPLLSNKENLVLGARNLFTHLLSHFPVAWDDRGNIGKRYASQDEIGTPFCITYDFQSLEDKTVTVRDRDTQKQERVLESDLVDFINSRVT